MELCHKNIEKGSSAIEKLGQFIREWQLRWEQEVADFERFEHELHEQIQTVEREMLMEALARYDVNAEQIEVGGVTYQQALTSSETYLTASGLVTVERHLYRPAGVACWDHWRVLDATRRATRGVCDGTFDRAGQ